MTAHLDDNTMAALAEGGLNDYEEPAAFAHLSECASCRELFALTAQTTTDLLAGALAKPSTGGDADGVAAQESEPAAVTSGGTAVTPPPAFSPPVPLGPCPWCGSSARIIDGRDVGYGGGFVGDCDNRECGGLGPCRASEAEATAAWNRRAPVASGVVTGSLAEQLLAPPDLATAFEEAMAATDFEHIAWYMAAVGWKWNRPPGRIPTADDLRALARELFADISGDSSISCGGLSVGVDTRDRECPLWIDFGMRLEKDPRNPCAIVPPSLAEELLAASGGLPGDPEFDELHRALGEGRCR